MSKKTSSTKTTPALNAELFSGFQLHHIAYRLWAEKGTVLELPFKRWLFDESNQRFLARVSNERFGRVLLEAAFDAWDAEKDEQFMREEEE